MNNGEIRHIKSNYTFDKSIGNIYINGHGIDRYIAASGEVLLVHVTSGGKWINSVKPQKTLYQKMYDEAADGAALLVSLGNRFFNMNWEVPS